MSQRAVLLEVPGLPWQLLQHGTALYLMYKVKSVTV